MKACSFGWLAALMLLAGVIVPSRARAEEAPDHRILVMLRSPVLHYRPGASYGGAYGAPISRAAQRRVARRIARGHALTLIDDWPMPLLDITCFVMLVPGDRSPQAVVGELSRDPAVQWSQPINRFQAMGDAGADPLFAAQPATRAWHLADLHRIATGRDVAVAVIDSGVDRGQPDLVEQVAVARDFVTGHPAGAEAHGTGVAGIVAARAGNGVGIVGVAPAAKLMALRACWQEPGEVRTLCDSLTLAKALHFAIDRGAPIINMSLSGPPDLLLRKLVQVALARGLSVVAAIDRALPGGGFPATVPDVIAVSEAPTAMPALLAPGRDVPTTEPRARWALVNGSSYAAAHVSGLLALMRQRHRRLRPAMRAGGLVDACASLGQMTSRCECTCAVNLAVAARPVR